MTAGGPGRARDLRGWAEAAAPPGGRIDCASAGTAPVTMLRTRVSALPPDLRFSEYVVALVLDGPLRARLDLGYGRFEGQARPGSFLVLPPERRIEVESESSGVALLDLAIPADRFARDDGPPRPDPERLHARFHADPLVVQLVHRLWDEASAGNPWGDLFADHAIDTLVVLVARLADPAGGTPPARGRLSAAQLAAVVEYIMDNLGRRIGLDELAAVAHLSRFHFARLFRASTGQAPHQFVIAQRVERAKALLSRREMSLAEVAVASGFTDRSQFARHFRRVVGRTPGRYGRIRQE